MSTTNLARREFPASYATESFPDIEEADFVCRSAAMIRIIDQVRTVGPYLRVAAIEGESGVGKHSIGRLLHRHYTSRHPELSRREFSRFDASDWLGKEIDPELLSGFIFLDRVDLLTATGQSLLLRILKDIEFLRNGTPVVLCSSESSLRELAQNGAFLSALALRLTSVRLAIPPLRKRKEDIIPLSLFFLNRISARYHLSKIVLTSEARAQLLEHDWPGNLHELSSALESAAIACSNGIIQPSDLALRTPAPASPSFAPRQEILNLDAVIQNHILHVLHINRGNKVKTSRQLGISRSTLYRHVEKGLSPSR